MLYPNSLTHFNTLCELLLSFVLAIMSKQSTKISIDAMNVSEVTYICRQGLEDNTSTDWTKQIRHQI